MFSQSLLVAGFETTDGTEGVQTLPNENKHIHEQVLQQQLNPTDTRKMSKHVFFLSISYLLYLVDCVARKLFSVIYNYFTSKTIIKHCGLPHDGHH